MLRKIFCLAVFVAIIFACVYSYRVVEEVRQNKKIEELEAYISQIESSSEITSFAISIVTVEQRKLLLPSIQKQFSDIKAEQVAAYIGLNIESPVEKSLN